MVGEFIAAKITIESALKNIAWQNSVAGSYKGLAETIKSLKDSEAIPPDEADEINNFRKLKNDIINGKKKIEDVITNNIIIRIKEIAEIYRIFSDDDE
ncbi:hypothetical protein ACFLSX_04445 [Calditrichota bacterium]